MLVLLACGLLGLRMLAFVLLSFVLFAFRLLVWRLDDPSAAKTSSSFHYEVLVDQGITREKS